MKNKTFYKKTLGFLLLTLLITTMIPLYAFGERVETAKKETGAPLVTSSEGSAALEPLANSDVVFDPAIFAGETELSATISQATKAPLSVSFGKVGNTLLKLTENLDYEVVGSGTGNPITICFASEMLDGLRTVEPGEYVLEVELDNGAVVTGTVLIGLKKLTTTQGLDCTFVSSGLLPIGTTLEAATVSLLDIKEMTATLDAYQVALPLADLTLEDGNKVELKFFHDGQLTVDPTSIPPGAPMFDNRQNEVRVWETLEAVVAKDKHQLASLSGLNMDNVASLSGKTQFPGELITDMQAEVGYPVNGSYVKAFIDGEYVYIRAQEVKEIPVPDAIQTSLQAGTASVLHLHEGSIETLPIEKSRSGINFLFDTDHFSPFMLVLDFSELKLVQNQGSSAAANQGNPITNQEGLAKTEDSSTFPAAFALGTLITSLGILIMRQRLKVENGKV